MENDKVLKDAVPSYYSNMVNLVTSDNDVCLIFNLNIPEVIGDNEIKVDVVPQARIYLAKAQFLKMTEMLNRNAGKINKENLENE